MNGVADGLLVGVGLGTLIGAVIATAVFVGIILRYLRPLGWLILIGIIVLLSRL